MGNIMNSYVMLRTWSSRSAPAFVSFLLWSRAGGSPGMALGSCASRPHDWFLKAVESCLL